MFHELGINNVLYASESYDMDLELQKMFSILLLLEYIYLNLK